MCDELVGLPVAELVATLERAIEEADPLSCMAAIDAIRRRIVDVDGPSCGAYGSDHIGQALQAPAQLAQLRQVE